MLFRYFLAWFGMMIAAVVNGGMRDRLYKTHVGERTAHQISTVIFLCALTVYFRMLTSVWRIASSEQAWMIGVMWLVMTLAFEFGLGRLILGKPWSAMFHDYNVLAGRVWVLIPMWVFIGPYVFFRLGQNA